MLGATSLKTGLCRAATGSELVVNCSNKRAFSLSAIHFNRSEGHSQKHTPTPTENTPSFYNRRPNLSKPDPVLDVQKSDVKSYPHLKTTVYNVNTDRYRYLKLYGKDNLGKEQDNSRARKYSDIPGLDWNNEKIRSGVHHYELDLHPVVTMTGKGRQKSMYCVCVVGNGKGLVGLGEGVAQNTMEARDKAFRDGLRNMDAANLNEDRTIYGRHSGKFGAAKVELRQRPAGFGLICGPLIHQIAKAAGIRDLSSRVFGARNKMNTAKLVISLLHGSSNPIAFGDGFGGRGRRIGKGVGIRSADEVAARLGRKAVVVN